MGYEMSGRDAAEWSIGEFKSHYQSKPVRSFEDLWIWQEARAVVKEVYSDCRKGQPGHEDTSFRDHIQKTAVSMMNNATEGFERGTNTEFARFLEIAKGSAGELRSMYYTAEDMPMIYRAFRTIISLATEG